MTTYGPITPEEHRKRMINGLPMVVPFTEEAVVDAFESDAPSHIQDQIRRLAIQKKIADLRSVNALPADPQQADRFVAQSLEAALGDRDASSSSASSSKLGVVGLVVGFVVVLVVLGVVFFRRR